MALLRITFEFRQMHALLAARLSGKIRYGKDIYNLRNSGRWIRKIIFLVMRVESPGHCQTAEIAKDASTYL